jgi:hypothetical protein
MIGSRTSAPRERFVASPKATKNGDLYATDPAICESFFISEGADLLTVCAGCSSRGSGDRVVRTKADAVLSPMHRDRKGGLGQPPGTSARVGTEES